MDFFGGRSRRAEGPWRLCGVLNEVGVFDAKYYSRAVRTGTYHSTVMILVLWICASVPARAVRFYWQARIWVAMRRRRCHGMAERMATLRRVPPLTIVIQRTRPSGLQAADYLWLKQCAPSIRPLLVPLSG
jgi:hypothetical protein